MPLASPQAIRPNLGIYATEQEALDGVVARLVEALDPQAIWLFGSRARGDHRPDSDFDLLVVAKQGQAWANDYRAVLRPLHETSLGCDVVPCSGADFEEGLTLHTSLISQIVLHDCCLYNGDRHSQIPHPELVEGCSSLPRLRRLALRQAQGEGLRVSQSTQ